MAVYQAALEGGGLLVNAAHMLLQISASKERQAASRRITPQKTVTLVLAVFLPLVIVEDVLEQIIIMAPVAEHVEYMRLDEDAAAAFAARAHLPSSPVMRTLWNGDLLALAGLSGR